MSRIHKSIILISFFFTLMPVYNTADAIDLSPSEDMQIYLKGRINYAAKWRMEEKEKADPTSAQQASGNTNFEIYDIINNKGTLTLELDVKYSYFSIFASGNAFYDRVYADEDFYDKMSDGNGGTGISDERRDEIRKHAAYRAEMFEYYFQTTINTFTCRMGSQIVQWGDSITPYWAPGINIVNSFNFDKLTSVGYTSREMQEPAKMAWVNFGVFNWLTVEAVYKPDFDPRNGRAVVGTWNSLMDQLGYGSYESSLKEDRPNTFFEAVKEGYPDGFKDIHQYGGAVKTTWGFLSNLDVGFYYFHYLNNDVPLPVLKNFTFVYPEIDMYGMTVGQAIEAFDLNLQITGELAYRPNDAEATNFSDYGPIGDYEEVQTLTWNISFSRVFDDLLLLSYITPWRFSTFFMGEIYGKRILDYDEKKNFYSPQNTCYYTLPLKFETNDMIDNTTVSIICSLSGMLHKKDRSYQQGGFGIGAKYGDRLEAKVIYFLKLGRPESDPFTDRDDLSAELSWYF